MQKNIFTSILISIAIITGTFYLVSDKSEFNNGGVITADNVVVKDGVQYVTVTAKGGYFPRESVVKPDIPTKLLVKTNGTYDCSVSLVIRSVNFQKILQPSGEEAIDLGILKSGEKIQGICGMGMYNFQIKAS